MGALTPRRAAAPRLVLGVVVLGALLLVLGCEPPYFSEIDAAAGLISHMTAVGAVGPAFIETGAPGNTATIRFLPSRPTAALLKDVAVTSGFAIASTADQDFVSFFYMNGGGSAQSALPGYHLPYGTVDPSFPFYDYEVVTANGATQGGTIIAFGFDPVSPGNGTYQEMQGDPASGQFSLLFGAAQPLGGTIFAANPVGASVDPSPPSPQSSFTFLLQNGALMNSGSTTLSNASSVFPVPASPVGPTAPVPGGTTRALVFSNPKAGSLVSQYRSGTSWVTVQWAGASSTTMTGVTTRLDAVLSDGDFLSTEGDTLTLYDSGGTGTQALSVPLHGMQFCYEAFVGSTPCVFFTLPITMRHGSLVFNVFAMPTSELRSLGQ